MNQPLFREARKVKRIKNTPAIRLTAALQREVAQHRKNGTFGPPLDPRDLPPGRKAIPFDCILKLKRDGTPKVRGILKGYRMTEGIDYNETFAPIPCLTVMRLLLAMTARYDWEAQQGHGHEHQEQRTHDGGGGGRLMRTSVSKR